jgi:ankyrin repeat protein
MGPTEDISSTSQLKEGISGMPPLLGLPNELFFEVGSHLKSFKDLNSLVRTSQFFHGVCNTELYRRAVTADDAVLNAIVGCVLSRYRLASLTLLLDNGLSVNHTGKFDGGQLQEPMLHFLCRLSDQGRSVPLARLLIQRGADTKAGSGTSSGMVLQRALEYGNCPIVALLLEHGADVNAAEIDGLPPLHYASKIKLTDGRETPDGRENPDMIHFLIAHGADIEARSATGDTPLILSSRRGNHQVMAALLEHGADAGAHNERGETALGLASSWIESQHHELAKSLLKHGAIINAPNMSGLTPLHLGESPFVAKFLLDNGAEVNAISNDGICPLHWAAADRNGAALVALLLHYGANVDATDPTGQTPLHFLLEQDMYSPIEDNTDGLAGILSIVKLLLDHGADVNAISNGFSPLHTATRAHFIEGVTAIMALLLDYGANVNETDATGQTPLHWVFSDQYYGGEFCVAKLLLENGADVNALSYDGYSPLQHALTYRFDADAVILLLEHGAIATQTDTMGRAPLHWLLEEYSGDPAGILSIAKRLLDSGADVNAISNNGFSPLKCALNGRFGKDVILLLLERGAAVGGLNGAERSQLALIVDS